MKDTRLTPKAWAVLLLYALFGAADSLCSIFVSVYLWINSLDFELVCRHYLTLYAVTPFVFILAGWYSAARDRLHMYRLGLALHVVYYATLLTLRERSPEYAAHLGALLGITWGVFYAGVNTLDFDVTRSGRREYYFGLVTSLDGAARLVAPIIGGLIIVQTPGTRLGYHLVFVLAIALYVTGFAVSFLLPKDNVRRPFRIWRALFPPRDQRDWRLLMIVSMTLAGSLNILTFLLALLMFMQTGSELSVGEFASFQALTSVLAAYLLGRAIVPGTRRAYMRWGVTLLVAGGTLVALRLDFTTLVLFGFLRGLSGPMFGIPHSGLRLDVISKTVEEPSQRIEYLSAWEVPLAVGRVIMMTTLMALTHWFGESDLGLRIAVFLMCAVRIATYFVVTQTSALRREV
jgi:YQGE family putative transporter